MLFIIVMLALAGSTPCAYGPDFGRDDASNDAIEPLI